MEAKKRCPNGSRKNKIGECVKTAKKTSKQVRCKKGTRRNKNTGECEEKHKSPTPIMYKNPKKPRMNKLKVKNQKFFDCSHQNITDLDLSKCPDLEKLKCYGNNITKLDLSKCPNLVLLQCNDNKLKDLDISHCPNLAVLHCSANELKELDISQNDDLIELVSENNPFRTKFDYDIDEEDGLERYRDWCKDNYSYHNEFILK